MKCGWYVLSRDGTIRIPCSKTHEEDESEYSHLFRLGRDQRHATYSLRYEEEDMPGEAGDAFDRLQELQKKHSHGPMGIPPRPDVTDIQEDEQEESSAAEEQSDADR